MFFQMYISEAGFSEEVKSELGKMSAGRVLTSTVWGRPGRLFK